ncbi:phage tail protein [Neobacillus sp. YIM B02564]|uniref:Phage tail protein n=1 Tax=Neobacillus paridis TaxID=2803862 RepID=A0ABS1TI33_9BACI|nr:phage tail spike protein [Neobacillus paridis]MBL4950976.1 phage tail protein [Neobacillus paridis]
MKLGEIDLSLIPLKPQLSICLPNLNRTVIGIITEARDITHDIFLGKINELSFKIPFKIEKENKLIRNPNIDKLKERYLIKFQLGKEIEYYMINDINDDSDDTNADKTVHCYSIGWELNDKMIRGYQDTSINATEALNVALLESVWSIGYVDSDFDIRYRSFDVSENTSLEFIFQIADTFNGIVEFDTVNRLINLKKQDSIGTNKGLRLSYGKYLKTIGKESNSDEMVTRFHAFGSDDLSIQNVNPTGTTYLEDFSYFMYPYEEDENGNIINHSYYMSDSLCKAITKYNKLIESNKLKFANLLSQLTSKQSELTTRQVELDTLNNDLKIIEDKIDFAKAKGVDYSDLTLQQTAKNNEIDNKESEIVTIKIDITNIKDSIQSLRNEISIENNFTADQMKERNYYIIEKTWQDDNYIDENDLYEEAIKRFNDMKKPKTTFTIDIINFLNIVEEQRNWDKLSIGDVVTIKYDLFDTLVTAKIMEIHYDYEQNNISLTISDGRDISDEGEKIAKKIYDVYSTSKSLDMSKYKFIESDKKIGEINEIINSQWDSNKRSIVAGLNNSISISGRGIVITSPDEPNNQVIIQSGIVAVSNDYGNTWKNAITSSGLVGERIFGKILAGVNLTIENDSGKYKFDSNGFTIESGSINIIGGLPKSQLDPTFADGLFEIDKTYTNGIRMDAKDGIVVTRSDNTVKTTLNSTEGIKIQSYQNGDWKDKLYVDTNGNLTFSGNLSGASGTFSGTVSAATINGSNFSGGTITGTTITGTTIISTTINGGSINGADFTSTGDNNEKIFINKGSITFYGNYEGDINLKLDSDGLFYTDKSTPSHNWNIFWDQFGLSIDSNRNILISAPDSITIDSGHILLQGNNIGINNIYFGNASIGVGGEFYQGANSPNVSIGQKNIYIPGTIYEGGSSLSSKYASSSHTHSQYLTSVPSTISISQISANYYYFGSAFTYSSGYISAPSGTLQIGQNSVKAQTVTSTSNIEYKKNIQSWNYNATNMILSTPVKQYQFKNELDNEFPHVGIILQDAPVWVADIEGHGVDIYAMATLSWKAIQELNDRIKYLENEIISLKGE